MTKHFIDRLELVAGHPLVFVAFIILVLTWLARLFIIKKSDPLALVKLLPKEDRAKAVETILAGGVPDNLNQARYDLIKKRYNIFALIVTLTFFAVIGGLAVNFFSKSDEEVQKLILEKIDTKIDDNHQETKKALDRLTTEFNSIYVQTIFKAPESHNLTNDLKAFLLYLESLQVPGLLSHQYSQQQNEDGSFSTSVKYSYEIRGERSKQESIAFSQGIEKFPQLKALFKFFESPRLRVALNREAPKPNNITAWMLNHEKDRPELLLHTHESPTKDGNFFRLTLDSRDDHIYISWNGYKYGKDRWVDSRNITSLSDIGNAWIGLLFFGYDSTIKEYVSSLSPEWVNLKFDNNYVTATNLVETPPFNNMKTYTSRLPIKELILENKAHQKHPEIHLGGF